jgi:hypothetical protein
MSEKRQFLEKEFTPLLARLAAGQAGQWGRMQAQQMVEHMIEYVRIASGKEVVTPVLTPEQTAKAHAFMMSDKPFRENTPNQLMPDSPLPCRLPGMPEALAALQEEIDDFFRIYSATPGLRHTSPFFGVLGFDEQLHLLHKHATHHARQFGLLDKGAAS